MTGVWLQKRGEWVSRKELDKVIKELEELKQSLKEMNGHRETKRNTRKRN